MVTAFSFVCWGLSCVSYGFFLIGEGEKKSHLMVFCASTIIPDKTSGKDKKFSQISKFVCSFGSF